MVPSPTLRPFQIRYKGAHISWPSVGRRGATVEVTALFGWADVRPGPSAARWTGRGHAATLAGDARPSNTEANAPYWIENAPEALDETWRAVSLGGRQDRDPSRTALAGPGHDPKLEAIAPVANRLVRFDGEPAAGKLVRHIVLVVGRVGIPGCQMGPGRGRTATPTTFRRPVIDRRLAEVHRRPCPREVHLQPPERRYALDSSGAAENGIELWATGSRSTSAPEGSSSAG